MLSNAKEKQHVEIQRHGQFADSLLMIYVTQHFTENHG
jgi:hypothetical protein